MLSSPRVLISLVCLEFREQLSFPRRTFAPLLPSPDGSRFARLFCQALFLPPPCGRVYRPSADGGAIGVLAPRPLREVAGEGLCRVVPRDEWPDSVASPSAAGYFCFCPPAAPALARRPIVAARVFAWRKDCPWSAGSSMRGPRWRDGRSRHAHAPLPPWYRHYFTAGRF